MKCRKFLFFLFYQSMIETKREMERYRNDDGDDEDKKGGSILILSFFLYFANGRD